MLVAIWGKQTKGMTSEEYFLSSRSLRWHSIAFSTIATNIQGYQFLGMMGSAYLYGLAQASLEINAIQGILLASFVFIPYYLKDKIITITQFIKKRLGKKGGVALFFSEHFVVFNHHYRGSTFLGGIRCRYGFWRIFVLSASKPNYKNYCADNNPWIVFSDLYLFWWSKFCC